MWSDKISIEFIIITGQCVLFLMIIRVEFLFVCIWICNDSSTNAFRQFDYCKILSHRRFICCVCSLCVCVVCICVLYGLYINTCPTFHIHCDRSFNDTRGLHIPYSVQRYLKKKKMNPQAGILCTYNWRMGGWINENFAPEVAWMPNRRKI